jgi:hypothetical protein
MLSWQRKSSNGQKCCHVQGEGAVLSCARWVKPGTVGCFANWCINPPLVPTADGCAVSSGVPADFTSMGPEREALTTAACSVMNRSAPLAGGAALQGDVAGAAAHFLAGHAEDRAPSIPMPPSCGSLPLHAVHNVSLLPHTSYRETPPKQQHPLICRYCRKCALGKGQYLQCLPQHLKCHCLCSAIIVCNWDGPCCASRWALPSRTCMSNHTHQQPPTFKHQELDASPRICMLEFACSSHLAPLLIACSVPCRPRAAPCGWLQQDGPRLHSPQNSVASFAASKAKKAQLAQAKEKLAAAKASIAAGKHKTLQEEQAERDLAAQQHESAEETTNGRVAQRQQRSASKVRDSQRQCCTTGKRKH